PPEKPTPPDTVVPDDPPQRPEKPPEKPPERAPEKSVDQLVTEAQEAAFKGQYGKARKLCEQALELQPREPRAISSCAIAACNLGNARLAKRYYSMATPDQKNQIFQICRQKGIEVRE